MSNEMTVVATTETVREGLVDLLRQLRDPKCDAQTIERAKAASGLAQQFVGLVRAEVDAIKTFDDIQRTSGGVKVPKLPAPGAGRQ